MALVLAVYFLVGVAAQRFVCDPLTEPRGNRLFGDLERLVELEKAMFNERRDPDFNMTYVMLHCHGNQTIYKTLQLSRLLDLEALRAETGAAVAARVAALRPAFPRTPPTILRPAAKDKLLQLARTGLSEFDFERILHALESNLTTLALDSLARQLESTARGLTQPALAAEARALRRAAADLAALLADVLAPMLAYSAQLNDTALRLRDSLRLNHRSLKEAIAYLLNETAEAEVFLNTHGRERLQNITQEYGAVIAEKLNEYMDRVMYAAEHEVGRCGPISNAFNATRDAACNKILMPTNGYWMAMSWCVLLFVPLMVVAQRLARLYLHADPYPGPLVEAGSKRSTLDIEGKIAEWRERSAPCAASAPSAPPEPAGTRLQLAGADVVCRLVPAAAALMDDLKTRLDAKDEDDESGIHESE